MEKPFISVVIPTHDHGWEIDKVLFSLEKQYGIQHNEYELLIINSNPDDRETFDTAWKNYQKYGNVRLVQVYDIKEKGITNAGYCGNIGGRTYAKGEILILVVDSARIPTPMVLRKTRDAFERFGTEIVTTTTPYHIGKHYSDPSFTVEECRKILESTRWRNDAYHLFEVAAHTRISETGKFNESTYLGVTRENFMKVGGWNENFPSWGSHNIDIFRRFTRVKPIDGIQKVDVPGHWGKVGLGLKLIVLEGEADFHIHHNISIKRDHSNIKRDAARAWEEYARVGECIRANLENPNWGTGECEEIDFNRL